MNWRAQLPHDPIEPLLTRGDPVLAYFVRRDLLGEHPGPIRSIWECVEAQRILKKQLPDGSWPRAGAPKHAAINYALIESWRQFRFLVEKFELTREHSQVERAAEFLFSCQTPQGDIRGMLANQFATYYTGAILALLIRAGYAEDSRVERCLKWLLSMRQSDGGWTVPILTHKLNRAAQYYLTSEYAVPLEADRAKPFSHHCTGMVLRAFAAHPKYRTRPETLRAAHLLASRFFLPDSYTSYHAASYWLRFDFPFWWNNLVTALDSLSLIGLPRDDAQIARALDWLRDHQEPSGLWRSSYVDLGRPEPQTAKARSTTLWVSLAICRLFGRFWCRAA